MQFIVSGEAIIIAGISLVRLCYLLISSARENKVSGESHLLRMWELINFITAGRPGIR